MKNLKRFLSVFLAVVIVLGSAPLSGFVGLELPDWFDFSIKAEALTEGIYTYEVENGEVTVTNFDDYYVVRDIVIPSTLGGYPVTKIGEWAFSGCDRLTNVTIPDSITSIGKCAFEGCLELRSVIIPDSVTNIGEWAFYMCESLHTVKIGNGIKKINRATFYDCIGLRNLTFGNGITSIGDSAFYNCYCLESLEIPNGVINIDDCAFSGCDCIKKVTIPESVTSIGNGAFRALYLENIYVDNNNKFYSSDENGVLYNKDKTTLIHYPAGNKRDEFTIPESVTRICNLAFFASTIREIVIPNSVTTIENGAFNETYELSKVYYLGSKTKWNEIVVGSSEGLNVANIYCVGNKSFVKISGSTTVVDYKKKIIYGLDEGISSLESYVKYLYCEPEYNFAFSCLGTGTTVDIVKNGEVVDTFTIVIFGDITGDGYIDAFDLTVLNSVANYEEEFEEGSAQGLSGDLNNDTFIDTYDTAVLISATNFECKIEQSR